MEGQPPEEYRVTITAPGSFRGRKSVTAYLSEDVDINVQSSWESPFQDIANAFPGAGLATVLGQVSSSFSTQTQTASARVWKGTEPLSILLNLNFYAYANAMEEVVEQVAMLKSLALPTLIKGEMFNPPGPSIAARIGGKVGLNFSGGERISVVLGKGFAVFSNVVVQSVQVKYMNKMSKDKGAGNPSRPLVANVQFQFETWMTITKSDLYAIYGIKR